MPPNSTLAAPAIPGVCCRRRLCRFRLADKRFSKGAGKVRFDLFDQAILRHVDGDLKRGGKSDVVGSAMAFDGDAVQAEQHAAVVKAGVDAVAQHRKARAREQVAQFGEDRALERGLHQAAHQLGRTLGCLQGDVAGETVGDDHVDFALGDIVALDKADKFKRWIDGRAQQFGGATNLVMALQFLDADIQQADARAMPAKRRMRKIGTHDGKLHEVLRIAFNIGAEVQHHGLALHRRQEGSDCRALDSGQCAQDKFRHRHQSTGIAGRDDGFRLAPGNRVDGQAHAAIAATAQGLARFVVAGDLVGCVPQFAAGLQCRKTA